MLRGSALVAALAVPLLLIAACGGGGGGAEPTPSPTAVPSPTPATAGQFQIAYVDDEGRDIWVVPADGIGEQNVTRGRCPRLLEPYWSPRGVRIACIGTGSAAMPRTQILVFDLDGRLLFDLKRDALFAGLSWPDMMEMSPSSLWSPTGQYLAYVLEEELTPAPEGGLPWGTPHLFIAETEQGHIRKAVSGGQQPRWSADGSRIAYNKPPDDTLVVYEPATGQEKVLGTGLRPLAWVLHDTSLLVAANVEFESSGIGRTVYEANLLDLSSGEMTRVPELDNNAEFWPSPDGTKAVVLRRGTSLAVLDLVRLRLTDIAGSVITYGSDHIPRRQLTFTPDGSHVYWFDGNEAIYSAKSDGTGLTQVGPLRDATFLLGFSPDATQVLYYPGAEGAGLWVANVDGSDAHTVAANASTTPLYAAWGPQASLSKPIVVDGLRVVPIQFGEEMELPEDVALIIETGCYYCDGPPTGLYRLYRDASGQLRTDALFTLEALGLPLHRGNKEDAWDESYITGIALSDDASEIAAGVCTRGYCGGLGFPTADAETTLYRSLDGGVTWTPFGVLDGGAWVVAVVKDGVVVSGPYGTEEESPPKFSLFPGGEPVQPTQPPPGVSGWPLMLPGGELAWRTEDGRLLRSDGSEALALGEGAYVGDIVAEPNGERFAVTWWTDWPSSQNRIGLFSPDGRPINAFSLSDSARVGGWLSDTLVAGNATVPQGLLPTPEPGRYVMNFVPVIIDLETGQTHPLAGPFHELPLSGRNYVRAVLHGPFARVVNTGSCLNVRAEPAMAAPVLACAADGALLQETGETREADGATWRRVVMPAGVEGWASSQYLEV